jgi:DNA-binding winged helix-turn-helix (wHTH) protein
MAKIVKTPEQINYKQLVVKYIETLVQGGYNITDAVFHHKKIDPAAMLETINESPTNEFSIYFLKG